VIVRLKKGGVYPVDSLPKLTIELVPQRSWFQNVRTMVSPKEWDRIRFRIYERSNRKCEICGGRGKKWPVECHEMWEYDDKKRIQKLIRMIALCPTCHQVKHIGLSEMKGLLPECLEHLAKINNWTLAQANNYAREQVELWRERSEFDYEIDVDYLKRQFEIDMGKEVA
jgi:hypothetical protein